MTAEDLDIIVSSVAPVMREFVTHKIAGLLHSMTLMENRMAALETKAAEPGPRGEPGEPGASGPVGPPGPQGDPGVGEKGEPGRDADPETVKALVAEAVSKIPAPKDGRDGSSVTVEDIAPVVKALVADAVSALPAPKDGAPGRDGVDGQPGRDGRDGAVGIQGEKGLDGLPGSDGKDGTPGRDGTLENLKALFDGERTVTLAFKDGTPIEGGVIRFPVMLDRGVFKAGQSYEPGDATTWGGSLWICQQPTSAKPGESGVESRSWRLAVKKGSDGKTGAPGPVGPMGPRGDQGPQGRTGY